MPDRDPELTPEQEARLRLLLADARHGDPIPVDVAARLDRVLEQLGHEDPEVVEPSGQVVDLAARRRRRVTGLLVAAAAVVVLGVGVGQAVRTSDPDGQADSSSAAAPTLAQDRAEAAEHDGGALAGTQDVQSEPPAQQSIDPGDNLAVGAPVRLTESRFAQQVVRYRDVVGYRSVGGLSELKTDSSTSGGFMCPSADYGVGKLLAATYDRLPTVLAYRPPMGTTQTVELLRCGTGEVLRSTVLAER